MHVYKPLDHSTEPYSLTMHALNSSQLSRTAVRCALSVCVPVHALCASVYSARACLVPAVCASQRVSREAEKFDLNLFQSTNTIIS